MLEARLEQGVTLKKIFDAIKELVNDVNLDCSSTGIQLQAMDSSHVALVALSMKQEAFDNFRCDRSRCLGVRMSAISKAFKLCGNEDAVLMRHEDDGEVVTFVFENSEDRVSDCSLRLLELDIEHLGVPDIDFAATVNIPSRTFQKICQDLSVLSDSVQIEVTPKLIKFSTTGDIGGGNIVLKPKVTDEERIEIECQDLVSNMFALRYLNLFTKATPLSSQVVLQMSAGHPIVLTYHLNADGRVGHLKYYLAPKMEDEESQSQA